MLKTWTRVAPVSCRSLSSVTSVNSEILSSFELARPFTEIPKKSYLGAIVDIVRDPSMKLRIDILMKQNFEKFGPIYVLKIPGLGDRVMIKDPEDIQVMFNNDGQNPIEPGFDFWVYYRNHLKKDLYPSGGLIGNHGEEWWKVRSLVQQDMLRPKSAMFYINCIEEISQEFVDKMVACSDSQMEVDDVTKYIYRWSLESVAAIFLNYRFNCLAEDHAPGSDTARLIDAVGVVLGPDAMELSAGIPIWKYIPTPYYKRFDKASDEVYKVCKKYIDIAAEEFKCSGKTNTEDMSMLEKLIHKCGPESTIPTVMAMDSIGAGIDTTGNTVAFLLYDLAQHPEQQERLYQEIIEVVGEHGQVTEAKLKKLRYLKACYHESQRMKPAVMGFNREVQTDIAIRGYQIPKGKVVSCMHILTMMDEKNFEKPEQFIPERWLRGCPSHHKAAAFAAIPFSHGPRMCIGRRFAELEVFILAIKVLQRFRLEYHHEVIGMATEFVVRPDKKIKMRFVPRH